MPQWIPPAHRDGMGSGGTGRPGRLQIRMGRISSTTRANFDQTLHGATTLAGSFPPTDMSQKEIGGNLREWTWDSNETTTDANSSQNLVDDLNSTAFFVPEVKGYQPFFGNAQSAAQVKTFQGSDGTNWVLKKTIDFGRNADLRSKERNQRRTRL